MSSKIKFGYTKQDFCPLPDKKTAMQIYADSGDIEKWKKFANISKNLFMRKYLNTRQHFTCDYCGKLILPSMKPVVHHKSYMQICLQTNSENYDASNIPDCETCFFDHPDRFARCLTCLAYVHQGCHYNIHKETIEKSTKL